MSFRPVPDRLPFNLMQLPIAWRIISGRKPQNRVIDRYSRSEYKSTAEFPTACRRYASVICALFSTGRKPVNNWSITTYCDRSETPVGKGGVYTPPFLSDRWVVPNRQGMGLLVSDRSAHVGMYTREGYTSAGIGTYRPRVANCKKRSRFSIRTRQNLPTHPRQGIFLVNGCGQGPRKSTSSP